MYLENNKCVRCGSENIKVNKKEINGWIFLKEECFDCNHEHFSSWNIDAVAEMILQGIN